MIFATDIQGVLHQLPDKPLAAVAGLHTAPGSVADVLADALDLPLLQVEHRLLRRVRGGSKAETSGAVLFCDTSAARLDRIRLPGLRVRLRLQDARSSASQRHVLIVPNSAAWLGMARGDLYRDNLQQLGIDACVVAAEPNIASSIRCAAVVWNHALSADVASLVQHTQKIGAQLVNVNHSSHAFLSHTAGAFRKWLDACDAARANSHVWCVSQCQMPAVTGCERIRQVSCPVRLHRPRPWRPVSDPLRITLAGRCCPTKNLTNTLLAVALVKQQRQIRLDVCLDPTDELQRLIDLLNLKPAHVGQLPHEQWIEYLNTDSDILLQPSLTESYNMTATEAQQIGVPVVATATVHCSDPQLTVANANDSEEIARTIIKAADNYALMTLRAQNRGRRSAKQRNREYAAFLTTLNEHK